MTGSHLFLDSNSKNSNLVNGEDKTYPDLFTLD